MELMKFDPGKKLKSLRDEVNSLFDRFFERPLGTITGHLVPAMDLSETQNEITVKVDLPGMDREDIDISVSGDVLTVKGEKKQEEEQKSANRHLIERSYGSFTRSMRLPAAVDEKQIGATYRQGVLKIILPKKESDMGKKIEIQVEG